MRARIADWINRTKAPIRREKLYVWMNRVKDYILELNRPIDCIVEGGPFLRGITGIVTILSLIVVSWTTAGRFTQIRTARITLFSAGTNIFLTVGLLWIYLSIAQSEQTQAKFIEQQTELQRKLQSLQNNQLDIMGAEFEPVIEINEFRSGDERPAAGPVSLGDTPPHRGDFVHIEMSNLTDAIATNLCLRFIIDYGDNRNYVANADIPLSPIDNNQTLSSKPGGVIQGQQSKVNYHCLAGLSLPLVGHGKTQTFSSCLSTLSNNGVSHLRIGVLLVFEDRKGKEHEINLKGLELTSSNWPNSAPTFARVRNMADEVPVDLVKEGFLKKGIPNIPPPYR